MPIPEDHSWQQSEDVPTSAGLSSFNLLDEQLFFSELALKPGMTLLDYGCGLGNYSIAAAPHIGPTGRIFACDPWDEGIETLEIRAAMAGYAQIHAAVCKPSGRLSVEDREIDLCLLATVVHVLEQDGLLAEALSEIKRVLKQDGMLAIVEFHKKEGPPGPPLSWRISPKRLVEVIGSAGFLVTRTVDVGPHNYLALFSR